MDSSESSFDKIINRKGTGSTKWDKYINYQKNPDIIPMWVADSDFQTCPAIIDALQKRVAHGVFGYTTQPTENLSDAITTHLETCYQWKIKKEWIILLPSLVSGLNLSCQIAGEAGDTIITPATIYPPFKSSPINAKRKLLTIPMLLNDEQRWVFDFDSLEQTLKTDTKNKCKMLLFCNPHNPGGTVYTEQELTHLQQICERYNLLICSDEIHCDLILEKNARHIPFATLNDDAAMRTITLMAASKTFNIAGLSCGFAIVPNKKIRNKLKQSTQGLLPEVNALGQVATVAAFTHGHQWMKQQNDYLRGNRDYLYQEINAIQGLSMVSPEATFLAWIDVAALNLDDPLTFFEAAGVGLSDGKSFGEKRFMRLNFACSRKALETAVERIQTAVSMLVMGS